MVEDATAEEEVQLAYYIYSWSEFERLCVGMWQGRESSRPDIGLFRYFGSRTRGVAAWVRVLMQFALQLCITAGCEDV